MKHLKNWLRKEYHQLKALSAKLKGKAEYGVQIFLENDFADRIVENNHDVRRLQKNLKNASTGMAYLLKKNLEETNAY